MRKRIGLFLVSSLLCAAFLCPARAGDYFAAHDHDYDWTHNLSCFHTENFTYLYGEHIHLTENGYLYQPAFTGLQFTIQDRDGLPLKDGATVKTGDVLTERRDGKSVVLTTFVYWGDVAADGRIDAADARKALRAAISLTALSDAEREAADLDNDGAVTPADARTILRKSVSLRTDEAREGGLWDDFIYRTTLLVQVPQEDCDAEIAALRSSYDEITDARILVEESVSEDSKAVIALLYVDSYENKSSLAEKISAGGGPVAVCSYALA